MRPRLKVCCIAGVDEMRLAVRYGASAVGLVSAMPSGPGPIDEKLIARSPTRMADDQAGSDPLADVRVRRVCTWPAQRDSVAVKLGERSCDHADVQATTCAAFQHLRRS